MDNVRGRFGELAATALPQWVRDVMGALNGTAWTSGIASDRKGRGEAINVDAYSVDEERHLAVVQVRQCQFHPNRWNRVRKDYYLVGRNENGSAFAHPVEMRRSPKVTETINAGVVLALCRIWGCDPEDLPHIVRNGDVAFVPVRSIPDGCVRVDAALLRASHVAKALGGDSELLQSPDGSYYVRGRGSLRHTKQQHAPARTRRGLWRVVEGVRAPTWGFTEPTKD